MNILFVNCCIRGEASRTMGLCRAALEEIRAKYPDATIQELCLDQEEIRPLHSDTLARRNALEHQKDFSDPMFRYAHQFAEAEIVVVGAPYWEYQFPALLRCYIEHISVNGVTFAYGEKEVLHDVSFTLEKNRMLALVGPSGGGKSTVANLLSRFWDVKQGQILVRGSDIRDIPLSDLMDQISMVFQRVYLFQDTVYNNIAMGRTDATREEVYEAARKARCYDFIMELPDGFDTVIGEGGASLSGGERQRISIARCILKDAPIVILDEATASVDPENEHLIQQALSALTKGKTILTIAHRLATIQHADQILVVEDGRIVQRGTHAELMTQGGLYRRFIEIREQAEGWRLA